MTISLGRRGVAAAILTLVLSLVPTSFASASTILSDDFGTGSDSTTVAGWTEGGNFGDDAEVRAASSGNDSASPNGGRFAVLFGEDGYICRSVNAAGQSSLQLSYYWRGDSDAENDDAGVVEYRTGGSCASMGGWTTIQTHNLNSDGSWSTQASTSLSASLDNTSFFLRFRASSSQDDEHFRLDRVLLAGAVIDNTAPSGYTVNIDQALITQINQTAASFTFAGAEVGTTYLYSFDDTNGSTPAVTGTGAVISAGQQVAGINVSALDNGTLTLSVALTDAALNKGATTTDTVAKDTSGPSAPVIATPATSSPIYVNSAGFGFGGTADAGSLVKVFGGTGSSGEATTTGGGAWGTLTTFLNLNATNTLEFVALDADGNKSGTTTYTVVQDSINPTGSLFSSVSNPTNQSPFSVMLTWSEPVVGFELADVDVDNGTTTNLVGGPSVYTFDVIPANEGSVKVNINSGRVDDVAGNENTAVPQLSRTYAASVPSVVITSPSTNGTYLNSNLPNFDFIASTSPTSHEPIVTLECSIEGIWGACGGITSHSATTTIADGGPYTFYVRVTDNASNQSTSQRTFFIDTTRPVPTISSAVVSPTSAASVSVMVDFDVAVTGFDAGDLSVSNASVSDFAGSGTSYSFNLNPIGNGSVSLGVPEHAADEANGSGNTSVASAVLSFTYEVPPPACNSSSFDAFTLGSVNGQGGWSITGPYDQEVVVNNYGFISFGCQTLRISDAVTSGLFGDQLFSPSNANEAGETAAATSSYSGGTRQSHFEAQFDLASAVPGSMQSGLHLSVSPDRGDGARMSYLRFEDQSDGIHIFFDDAVNLGPLGSTTTWRKTQIAGGSATTSALTRSPHTVKFSIDFVDGAANDVVQIYIDGTLVHTGTTWEDYYRYDTEQTGGGNQVPTTDSLIFRNSGDAHGSHSGEGFLVDNFSELSSTPTPTVIEDTDDSSGGSGGSSFRRTTSTGGEVLGAETGPAGECSAMLKTYMRLGADNDTVQVMLLQNFLNIELGTTLAVSGIFDLPTDTAVRAFQAKYAVDILAPWGLTEPTGLVYTLTLWKINDMVCPGTAPKSGLALLGAGGVGGMGDGTVAPSTQGAGVAAGVVLGDENAASSTSSSTASKNPAAAALSFGAALPSWFWLLVLALILLGYSSYRAYKKYGTQA